jgi:hypothetical protein
MLSIICSSLLQKNWKDSHQDGTGKLLESAQHKKVVSLHNEDVQTKLCEG